MNDDKGKGRVSRSDENEKPSINEPQSQGSSSILGRVAASATGLAQSAFAAPNSNELSDAASAALTSAEKGRPPGGIGGPLAESSFANQRSGLSSRPGHILPSVRAGHGEEHIRDAESEFSSFLDSIDSFTPSSEVHNKADLSEGSPLDIPLERAIASTNTRRDRTEPSRYDTIHEQQNHDGDSILSILSRPSTATDELDAMPVEEGIPNWGMTDRQISQLRELLDDLFHPPEQHKSMSIEHPLNLVPSMVSTSDLDPFLPTVLGEPHMYSGNLVPSGTARRTWMEQWEAVLTRYADEVWGDLLPLVVEAREEIKAINEDRPGAPNEQPTALRRLRLILDHVRNL